MAMYVDLKFVTMIVCATKQKFNGQEVHQRHRRRVAVTPKAMSENGAQARKKTTIHKLVDYFGAVTVPGMSNNYFP